MLNVIKYRDDVVYVNATIKNNTNSTIFAEYDVDMTDSYLDQAGLYYLAIVRFDIPNVIPIFSFVDNKYQVTLRYNNTNFSQYLVFQNVDFYNTGGRFIWSFQQFLNIANQALQDAFDALKLAFPAAPPNDPPYLTYNSVTKLFTMTVPIDYDPSINPNTVGIYWNHAFNLFFDNSYNTNNFGINLPSGLDYQMIVQDTYNNLDVVNGVYNFVQEISTTANFFDFARLVIASSQLPVVKEFLTTISTNGNTNQSAILTDFIPTVGQDRTDFIYNANPLRFIDLDGNLPLKTFGFKIFWISKSGDQFLYQIPPGYAMSVKFGFFVKNQTAF